MSKSRRFFTEEKKRELFAALLLGLNRKVAADCVGCSPQTIWRTARRDPEFAKRLRQLEGKSELALLHSVQVAAKDEKNWRAAAWALERLFPDRYSRRGP